MYFDVKLICTRCYRERLLTTIFKRCCLPEKNAYGLVLQLETAIENQEVLSMEPLADTLMKEPSLADDRLPLIKDMLLFNVQQGII